MSEAIKILQNIGVQKIHEDTHISRSDAESIIHERYSQLRKVQLLGFISILQREYELDLSSLKNNALAYYKEEEITSKNKSGVFVVAKKTKNSSQIYIVIIAVIFLAAVSISIGFNSKEDVVEVQSVENKIIQDVKKEIKSQELDINSSLIDENITKIEKLIPEVEIEPVQPEKVELQPFTIKAKSKVWIGYIDVETNKKYSKVVKNKLTLERDREWILILGHSYVTIRANGIDYKFSTKEQLRLHYKDGVVNKISLKEFKKLNRGRKW